MNHEKGELKFFDSTEVSEVVGIPPIYLNKFIERKKYGIAPSVRTGKGRGSRRIFSEMDVLGIALVWWLFESGLRSETIQKVLNNSVEETKKNITAGNAAWLLRGLKIPHLAIKRQPRIGNQRGKRRVEQTVLLDLTEWGPTFAVEDLETEILIFIPIQNLFGKLEASMHELDTKRNKLQRSE